MSHNTYYVKLQPLIINDLQRKQAEIVLFFTLVYKTPCKITPPDVLYNKGD